MKQLLLPVALAAVALPTVAQAQRVPAAVVVVVDTDRIYAECTACRSAHRMLRAQAEGPDPGRDRGLLYDGCQGLFAQAGSSWGAGKASGMVHGPCDGGVESTPLVRFVGPPIGVHVLHS